MKYHKYGNKFSRPGIHRAYRLVRKDEATWKDIRGFFIATRKYTYWFMFGVKDEG